MADGTSVGKIYLDFVIQDTIQQQVQAMAAKAQAQVQRSMNAIEKSITETMNRVMSKAADAAQQASSKTAEAGQQMTNSVSSSLDKTVALAQTKVTELEKEFDAVSAKLDELWNSGNFDPGDKATQSLLAQQEKLMAQLEAAQNRLTIEVQAATQKRAAAEQAAAQKAAAAAERLALRQQEAAQKAAEKTAAAAERATLKQQKEAQRAAAAEEKAAQKAAAVAEKAAQKAAEEAAKAHERSAARIKKAFSAVSSIPKKTLGALGKAITSLKGKFSSAGKSAGGFSSRLKSIVSGALVFNGISAGLRKLTEYFQTAVTSSSSMQDALANLKGAAATAAAPFVELLTPALTALTNAAATAFSYLSRLISAFTGKTLSAMSSAAKKMQSTAGAAKKAMSSLAGFDQIQKLDSKDDSGGGGGAEIQPNFDYQGESSFLDSLLASVKSGDWGQIGALISQKLNEAMASIRWPNIQEKVVGWGAGIAQAVNGFTQNLDFAYVGSTISNALNTIIGGINAFFKNVDWTGVGTGIGIGLSSMFETMDWSGVGAFLTNGLSAVLQGLHGFVGSFDFSSLGTELATATMSAINNVNWVQGAKDLGKAAIGLFQMLTKWITGMDWQQIGNTIADAVAAVDWNGLVSSLVEGIGAACAGLAMLLWGIIEDAWNDFMQWWYETAFEDGQFTIEGLLKGIWEVICNIGSWINKNIFEPFRKGFCEAFGIHSPSRFMADMGKLLIDGLFSGLSKTWTNISSFFVNAFQSVKKAIVDIWQKGIVPAIKGPINSIIGFINGLISGICQGINTIIRAMNRLKWDVPDWVPGLGGKTFGFNLAEISAPKIPMLANGGVITQPTLAMMGEYAGARNNPEIVSPKSLIAQTVADAMREYHVDMVQCFDAVVSVLKDILEAVLGKELDKDSIYSMVENERKRREIITGGGGW